MRAAGDGHSLTSPVVGSSRPEKTARIIRVPDDVVAGERERRGREAGVGQRYSLIAMVFGIDGRDLVGAELARTTGTPLELIRMP